MNTPRVALVTPRFWPSIGPQESMVQQLALALAEEGTSPLIVTARWQRHWPESITYRHLPVIRLSPPRPRRWGSSRYLAELSKTLREQANSIDLVYVVGVADEARTALSLNLNRPFPLVIRPLAADLAETPTSSADRRIWREAQQADSVVVASPWEEQQVLARGIAAQRICQIPPGIRQIPPTDGHQRLLARSALATAHSKLALPRGATLVISMIHHQDENDLSALLHSWKNVSQKYPHAFLWLVGPGSSQSGWRELVQRETHNDRVIAAGTFDMPDEILRAANIFVQLSPDRGAPSPALLEAMAYGLPVIIGQSPSPTAHSSPSLPQAKNRPGFGVAPHDSEALTAALSQFIEDRSFAQRQGAEARQHVQQYYSDREMAQTHLQLFDRLLAEQANRGVQ